MLRMKFAAKEKIQGSTTPEKLTFINAELHTAHTFCEIARQSSTNPTKRERNRKKARLAYDTILRYRGRTYITAEENKRIDVELARLRRELQNLGEEF